MNKQLNEQGEPEKDVEQNPEGDYPIIEVEGFPVGLFVRCTLPLDDTQP